MEVIGIPFNIKKAKELLNEKYKERKRIYSNIFENGKVKEAVNFINNKNYKKAMEQYNKKVQDKLQQGEEFKGKKPDKALGKYGSINFNVEFNPNSTDHKRVLFLEVLGLKPLKETSAGLVSVDSETCIKWAEENPKIDILNYFSKVAKLEKEITSFYEPYIRKSENSIDGRIRGFYRISGTISGRISMTDVNILQVPRDSDFKYFLGYPEDSEYFVIGDDITNLEGNQLTLISKDEALMKIREEAEGDGHSWLGINLANLGIELFKDIKGLDNSKLEDIKYVKKNYPNLRHIAKTANFSCIFGISGMGLARDLGIPKTDGEAIVDGFWETHKQAKEFFDSRELKAKKEGYVDLIGGAKLLTPDANHSDIKIQSKSIKSSNNATIQSGSWITHRAMINICNIAYEKGWDLKPLTPWHDACYFQCHKDILFEASQVIQKEMERPFMENQIYNLEGLPELGKSLKGGCELKGTLEEKLEIYNKFKKDNKIE
jgi:DNA polymerase-1